MFHYRLLNACPKLSYSIRELKVSNIFEMLRITSALSDILLAVDETVMSDIEFVRSTTVRIEILLLICANYNRPIPMCPLNIINIICIKEPINLSKNSNVLSAHTFLQNKQCP